MRRDHRRGAPVDAASSAGQVARDLAADVIRELLIYQLAAEELHELHPDAAFAYEEMIRDVRQLVADVEVYLDRRPVDLLALDAAAVDELLRAIERARRERPVDDYEAMRSSLRPGGWYHETVVVTEAARALADTAAAARDEQLLARLGRAVRAAVASAGADPRQIGRLVRKAVDELTAELTAEAGPDRSPTTSRPDGAHPPGDGTAHGWGAPTNERRSTPGAGDHTPAESTGGP